MKRVIIFLLLALFSITFICADSLSSDSLGTNPSIPMILKPMKTSSTTVGFSSTSSTAGLTPITGTKSLKLTYKEEKNAAVTAGATIYPYWVVTGQSSQVSVKLNWEVLDSAGNEVNDIFKLTDSSSESLSTGMTLTTVRSGSTEIGSTEINVSTVSLNEKDYEEVYTLTFTLTAET